MTGIFRRLQTSTKRKRKAFFDKIKIGCQIIADVYFFDGLYRSQSTKESLQIYLQNNWQNYIFLAQADNGLYTFKTKFLLFFGINVPSYTMPKV